MVIEEAINYCDNKRNYYNRQADGLEDLPITCADPEGVEINRKYAREFGEIADLLRKYKELSDKETELHQENYNALNAIRKAKSIVAQIAEDTPYKSGIRAGLSYAEMFINGSEPNPEQIKSNIFYNNRSFEENKSGSAMVYDVIDWCKMITDIKDISWYCETEDGTCRVVDLSCTITKIVDYANKK